jgi:NHL repeat
MKLTRLFTSLFALTLCLAVLSSASFAVKNHLNNPIGLAVDASGNLYVANQGANQILVYNSGYVQQTSKTITSGINTPTGLAIDAYGNLWVANYSGGASGSITEYTARVMQSANTITDGISGPQNMAFDELGDLWVNNNASDLTMYAPTSVAAPPSSLVQTISISNLWAVGEAAGTLYTGFSGGTCIGSASAILRGGTSYCDLGGDPTGGSAFAADNKGGEYEAATFSGNTVVYNFVGGVTSATFVSLPFTPSFNECGMAVDNVKQRLYVSNRAGNEILVYSTKSGATYGTLIHTIPTTG